MVTHVFNDMDALNFIKIQVNLHCTNIIANNHHNNNTHAKQFHLTHFVNNIYNQHLLTNKQKIKKIILSSQESFSFPIPLPIFQSSNICICLLISEFLDDKLFSKLAVLPCVLARDIILDYRLFLL